ncbi:hypothetical protein [Fulvivirga sediminis]|uniref:Uncharacterized protein n=1 Tax=Fulvivirga sediminis TaxID=2803949 RepID=A0A937F6L7_9BACT|nr:hypothetical protein [Fulvivirga sediminis]MBL3656705.1 hypothetical protein [Fulvivirga sediminis]
MWVTNRLVGADGPWIDTGHDANYIVEKGPDLLFFTGAAGNLIASGDYFLGDWVERVFSFFGFTMVV